jgi:hypothetical protein
MFYIVLAIVGAGFLAGVLALVLDGDLTVIYAVAAWLIGLLVLGGLGAFAGFASDEPSEGNTDDDDLPWRRRPVTPAPLSPDGIKVSRGARSRKFADAVASKFEQHIAERDKEKIKVGRS